MIEDLFGDVLAGVLEGAAEAAGAVVEGAMEVGGWVAEGLVEGVGEGLGGQKPEESKAAEEELKQAASAPVITIR